MPKRSVVKRRTKSVTKGRVAKRKTKSVIKGRVAKRKTKSITKRKGTKIRTKSVTKRKGTKRKMSGGAIRMPSEYFGKDSGRYGLDNHKGCSFPNTNLSYSP